jgi:hypothetical protein
MSLLLDALHRASKDKEKTASAAVVPTPVAAEPRPAETWQLTADFSDRAFPVLLPPVPRPAVVANDAANPIALTLEFEPVPKPVSESELSLPPVSSPAQTPDPAPKHAVQAEAVKLLAAKPTAASPPIEAPAAKKPESAPAPPARAA